MKGESGRKEWNEGRGEVTSNGHVVSNWWIGILINTRGLWIKTWKEWVGREIGRKDGYGSVIPILSLSIPRAPLIHFSIILPRETVFLSSMFFVKVIPYICKNKNNWGIVLFVYFFFFCYSKFFCVILSVFYTFFHNNSFLYFHILLIE